MWMDQRPFHPPEEQAGESSEQIQNIVASGLTQLSLNDAASSMVEDDFMFPRSEYKTRFEDTSAFSMSEPKHWGSYFRSTNPGGNCDRISNKYDKIYANANTNTPPKNKKIPATKAGTIYSPWEHKKYRDIFISGSVGPKKTDKNYTFLYDQLLEYKKSICSAIVEEFSKENMQDKKINVYYENNFPCVMVQVQDFHEKSKIKGETSSLYNIVIAYFTGITNKIAKTLKFPIELVNRASFGHNIPSVSETGTSFRINVGIVPRMYATKVLVKALKLLNKIFLVPLISKNPSYKLLLVCMNQEEFNCKNADIQRYNNTKARKQVEQWAASDDLFDVLCKVGNSSNMKVSLEIMRGNNYIDLLTDYVNEEINNIDLLDENLHEKISKDLAQPLRKILKKLDYGNKKVKLKATKRDFMRAKLNKFDDEQDSHILNDRQFWKIIEDIDFVFSNHDINILSETIKKKKIIGLYRKLEKANLEFIRKSGYQCSKEGFGSDSDCDFSIGGEGITFHSRKIIVSTGIRAINLAQFLATQLTNTTKANTKFMYYETAKAIKGVTDFHELLNLKSGNSEQEEIRYIDLTHCACDGGSNCKVPQLSARPNERVIVFDYTSATTERISEAIKLIEKVPVLLLVSSGLKNEQIGADMNPYGTLRIITKKKETLKEQYSLLEDCLAGIEELPMELHNIRKAYKEAGAVVKSAEIFLSNRGYVYSSNSNTAEYSAKGGSNCPEKSKRFELLYTLSYKKELNNLTNIHKQDIQEILSWSIDKIIFLGSSKVAEDIGNFSQLKAEYEKDPELAKSQVGMTTLMRVHRTETE